MPRIQKKIVIRVRRPVDITLATAPGSHGETYRIALDRHNMVYCTCKGWRYNGHSCPHLREFRERLAAAQENSK